MKTLRDKRIWRYCLAAVFFVFLTAITLAEGTQNGSSLLTIRSGTSFGECTGYCWHEIEISHRQVRYTEHSFEDSFRQRNLQGLISEEEWKELERLTLASQINEGDEVIGCPDCADGGAEWIEIEFEGKRRRKLTFAYGVYPTTVAQLGERLKYFRETYKMKLKTGEIPKN